MLLSNGFIPSRPISQTCKRTDALQIKENSLAQKFKHLNMISHTAFSCSKIEKVASENLITLVKIQKKNRRDPFIQNWLDYLLYVYVQ